MERRLGPRASFDLELPGYAYVTGDRDRIRQIVTNLIDNAAKYSREGGKITVSVEEHDGGVRLSVSDEGVGIPVTEQEAIFEKFYRVDPEQTHGGGGTGLGLYISRSLARAGQRNAGDRALWNTSVQHDPLGSVPTYVTGGSFQMATWSPTGHAASVTGTFVNHGGTITPLPPPGPGCRNQQFQVIGT